MQAEAGYFHPQVTSVTGSRPRPVTRSSRRSSRARSTRSTSTGAKKELTDAGFKLDGNILKDPTGKPVTITLTDPAGWSDYQTALEIIKDNLSTDRHRGDRRQGQPGRVVQGRRGGQLRRRRCTGPTAARRRTTSTRPSWTATLLQADRQAPARAATSAGSTARRRPRRWKAYANATDDAARTAALNTLQKIFVEQMPMIPTSARTTSAVAYSTKNWVGWPDDAEPVRRRRSPPSPTRWTSSCT